MDRIILYQTFSPPITLFFSFFKILFHSIFSIIVLPQSRSCSMVALKVYFHIITAVYEVGVVSIVWTAQANIVIISFAKENI